MTDSNACQIDPSVVAAHFVQHGEELRAFLTGVLRDSHLAADVMQVALVKAIEQGHAVEPESLKSWLFQVAYREALAVRRRRDMHQRASGRIAHRGITSSESPDDVAVRRETVEAVRQAVELLPASQQQIVKLRMYDELKFAEIAAKLNVPLGTVLARMQAALKRLGSILDE